MNNTVNVAIQVLPKGEGIDVYGVVDKAIETIQQSGLVHVVCPFETVVEGPYKQIMELIDKVQDECFKHGASELLTYIKIQRSANGHVAIADKTGKYS
ncbi:MAG: thiamine-binding protein [Bacteroidales bacterium]|nr:thiamine-binding protein [Bacteroidales bacterium]